MVPLPSQPIVVLMSAFLQIGMNDHSASLGVTSGQYVDFCRHLCFLERNHVYKPVAA